MPKKFVIFQVEELNSLVSELAKVAAKEQASLEQCKDFLSMIATMQVMQQPFHVFFFCVGLFITQIMINIMNCGPGKRL